MSKDTPITSPESLSYEEYTEKVKKLKTMSDVTNFAKELVGPTLQVMLEAEMTNHLGYDKHSAKGDNSGNSRNGYSTKSIKTSFGTEELKVPRDRQGEYEPLAVKKYQTIESDDVEEKIIAMYAKGLTTRDINGYLQDIYGVSVSPAMVSTITDKVMPLVTEWQNRPLDSLYAIIYLDGVHFKIRDNGRIANCCGYTALGVNADGHKELLGIWINNSEGSKFWLSVLTEIQNRGVHDILLASVDGLVGFSEAIKTVFPDCQVQQCLVHQVRNTIKYVAHKHRKEFCADLKTIYQAPTEEAGSQALMDVKAKWPLYELYLKRWEEKWDELSVFYQYAQPIRRIIYPNNAVESLHHQFRQVTKTTTILPHEEALVKLLWLAQRDILKKWNMPIQNWGEIYSHLSILFPERIKL